MLHMFYELYIYVYELKKRANQIGRWGSQGHPVCTYGLFSKADQVGDGGRRDLLLGLSPWQLAEVSLDTDERATNVTVRYVYCKQRLCEHPVVLVFFQDNFVFFIDNVLDSKHYTSREIGIKLWNWFLSEAIIKFFFSDDKGLFPWLLSVFSIRLTLISNQCISCILCSSISIKSFDTIVEISKSFSRTIVYSLLYRFKQ